MGNTAGEVPIVRQKEAQTPESQERVMGPCSLTVNPSIQPEQLLNEQWGGGFPGETQETFSSTHRPE